MQTDQKANAYIIIDILEIVLPKAYEGAINDIALTEKFPLLVIDIQPFMLTSGFKEYSKKEFIEYEKRRKKYKDIERYRLTRYSLNNELKNGTSLEFFTEKYTNEIIQKKENVIYQDMLISLGSGFKEVEIESMGKNLRLISNQKEFSTYLLLQDRGIRVKI